MEEKLYLQSVELPPPPPPPPPLPIYSRRQLNVLYRSRTTRVVRWYRMKSTRDVRNN